MKLLSSVSTTSTNAALTDVLLNGVLGKFLHVADTVSDVLRDMDHTLPQIIVVGQESSGKSSVLESIAMMPFFPRDENICTRMAIHLCLRHKKGKELEKWCDDNRTTPERNVRMQLKYSDGRPPLVSDFFSGDHAAAMMQEWMDGIVKSDRADGQTKGLSQHILVMEVTSPHVPDLDLVDLPGIVAGKLDGEPDDMMFQSRALVEKYMRMPHTLVLAAVPAAERVRNSQAFQLLQTHKLTDKTIGVLTMADRAMDPSNPKGPYAELRDRLDRKSGDVIFLKEGYVAVRNRDTRTRPPSTLVQARTEELQWFDQHLPGYREAGLAGNDALIRKLESILVRHIQFEWIPATMRKIQDEQMAKQKQWLALGSPTPAEILAELNSFRASHRHQGGRSGRLSRSNGASGDLRGNDTRTDRGVELIGSGMSALLNNRPQGWLLVNGTSGPTDIADRDKEPVEDQNILSEGLPHLSKLLHAVSDRFDFNSCEREVQKIVREYVGRTMKQEGLSSLLHTANDDAPIFQQSMRINSFLSVLARSLPTLARTVVSVLTEHVKLTIASEDTSASSIGKGQIKHNRFVNLSGFIRAAVESDIDVLIREASPRIHAAVSSLFVCESFRKAPSKELASFSSVLERSLIRLMLCPLLEIIFDPIEVAVKLIEAFDPHAADPSSSLLNEEFVLYESCAHERKALNDSIDRMSTALSILSSFSSD